MAEAGKEVAVKKGEIQKAPSRMLSPFEGFDRMFDDFLGRGWMRPFRRDWLAFPEIDITMPKVDVIDRDEEVVVRAEVPAVKKEDIEVSISGNMVTIKGETKKEEKEEKGDYYRSEISRGSFSRMVSLPADVDESKAKASLKDGVLELTLPKVEKAKRRTIKVD
jgi:HSP20 family protein